MMRLFVNGTAASAGGGLTYLRNVIPHLSRREDVQTTVAIDPSVYGQLPFSPNIAIVKSPLAQGAGRRFLWEQFRLPAQIQAAGAEVLLSTGNFALRKSPVPQVLLSGNSLYLSKDFSRDLRSRHEYRMLAEHYSRSALAKRSIAWADCTVAPGQSFAGDLKQWTGKSKIVAIHHGFDHDTFFRDPEALPAEVQSKLDSSPDSLRLLFVSHYNYYRNFETLFRSVALLSQKHDKDVKLYLTCRLRSEETHGSYQVQRAAALIQKLGIGANIVELGEIPNSLLHRVYRACQIYVTASYAETFAHPLVEAMACELPVVASDLPVHQEICRDAAIYFDRFSPQELAQRILEISDDRELQKKMSEAGEARSHEFSWSRHVEELLTVMRSLVPKMRA
jgi:glycosyltransferase involved in cell wall biosynthesis